MNVAPKYWRISAKGSPFYVMVDMAHGACIAEVGRHGAPSVADIDDSGRFVLNESLYGPGMLRPWPGMSKTWPLNPVQSGNYNNTIEPDVIVLDKAPGVLETITQMVDWIDLGPLPCSVRQRITLHSKFVHVEKQVSVDKNWRWAPVVRDQELAAVFAKGPYRYLRTGSQPAPKLLGELPKFPAEPIPPDRGQPGGWLALTNRLGYGLWITTTAPEFVGYRTTGRMSCGYVAPIQRAAITAQLRHSHKLVVGLPVHARAVCEGA